MTQDEIIEMATASGIIPWTKHEYIGGNKFSASDEGLDGDRTSLIQFGKLIAEKEREVVANWIMDKGFATGHGDSIVDLLDQLEWQIAEKEREACAKLVDYWEAREGEHADAIRARGQA